ncbi:type II secretion system F family protein [Kitasatospora viridis]|uniref:Type II secretion system (T2SS) protein F n=1 Tax=Kitasatospora viridis TaxID=281105 RepID=A0A561UIE0_9ACTN|nr:type II secretion system F family protein [Kitasatospora viridis]TWF99151.1 type II secretion system (T2SS) protein F [Kitasatospora viridis]
MSGFLGPYSVAPAALPLGLVVADAVGLGVLLVAAVVVPVRRWLERRVLHRRTARLIGPGLPPNAEQGQSRWRRRWSARAPSGPARIALLGGVVVAWLLPGAAGLAIGVLVGAALWRWLPVVRSPTAQRALREEELLTAQLPLAAELLAACLGSTASPTRAAEAVARTVGGPMERRLSATAAELSLGAPPAACWDRFGADSAVLAPLARCLIRTTVSGAPPAVPLRELAVSQRASAARAAHARVRRAGVLATAPLGLCFLPAFVLIGIAPVVLGLVTGFAGRI